ncbi:outer membrane lipoprotein-sorting protein [Sulfurimonas sp.]|uniref:outer membrane lipoprotein-sorting protein n=1 Tax=Sulfurimonas sp. TaxID=2022749 RepID=UPI0035624097
MRYLLLISLLLSSVFASEADEIIKKLDKNFRGDSIYMKISMNIKSLRHERTIKMETWAKGKNKSFVKITYPPRDRGITFLSLENEMWNYVPKIERIIKIPPSMMLQNWMGSDISNDDMVKQSSIIDDYNAKILEKDGHIVTIELSAKEDAPVVWGKIISKIDTRYYVSLKDVFYDEYGEEIRFFKYENVKKFGKYYLPTIWKIQPVDKKNNLTTMIVEDVKYDQEISDQYFKKSALKRFSR